MALTPHIHNAVKKLHKVKIKKHHLKLFGKNVLWFSLGSVIGLFFFVSFLFIYYQKSHADRVYEGVRISGVDFSGKTSGEVTDYFEAKNKAIQKTRLHLNSKETAATLSAKQIDFGYDTTLLARQAMTIGRSGNVLSDISLMFQAYANEISLPPAYRYSEPKIEAVITSLQDKVNTAPIDPLFNFANGKVKTFKKGVDGKAINQDQLKAVILDQFKTALNHPEQTTIATNIPITVIKAKEAEDTAENLGIKEEVAEGTSFFKNSDKNRIFNLSLAASRINGTIIKPNETFSFVKTIGDISALSGYHQAYVIQNGKTVLGDGGGVCQVSTTLFRAALNAGLPIVERHQHAYRVGYYEQNSGPGIDAAIYSPTVDLQFKNDTGHALLIQTFLDPAAQSLTFTLYGTKDNREVSMTEPIVTGQTPAPTPLFQDDPTLPKDQIKQIDFAAEGANVSFTRTVTKEGQKPHYDKFVSNYKPWQAVYLKGTM